MISLRFVRSAIKKALPKKVLILFRAACGFLVPPTRSYSQKGEDLIILQYFNSIGVKKGVYCDIGCFHPVWISNTHLLDKMGWHGFAIDIDEFKLRTMEFGRRQRVKCILGAVCGQAGEGEQASIYKFGAGSWSDMDTLDKQTAESYRSRGLGNYIECKINLIDINRLFSTLPHINFLNVDIEGIDNDVIMSLDFNKYKPDLILFEDNENWGGGRPIAEKFSKFGYEKLFVSGGSIAYALPPRR